MCCPTGCLKHILSFFSFITTGVGIAGIVFGTIGLVQIGDFDFANVSYTQAAPLTLIGLGVIALIIGIVGIVGAKTRNKCCLCIYQFSIFPLVLIGLGVAILATYCAVMSGDLKDNQGKLDNCQWYTQTNSSHCKACGDTSLTSWIKEANEGFYEVNKKVWGHTKECAILAKDNDQVNDYKTKYNFDFVYTEEQSKDFSEENKPKKTALDCSISNDQNTWGTFIHYFEQKYSCSGICAKTPFYAYSDSTVLPAETPETCYQKVYELMGQTLVVVIAWSIFVYFLLNLTLSCCLCCHPDKKKANQGEGLYQRMNYYDD